MCTFVHSPNGTQQFTSTKSTISRRAHLGQNREVKTTLHPCRTDVNQGVQRLLHANAEKKTNAVTATTESTLFVHDFSQVPIHPKVHSETQPKMKVSLPEDIYEREACRVADQVVRGPKSQLQGTCASDGGCPKCSKEQDSHEQLQTKIVQAHNSGETRMPYTVQVVISSPGQPLGSTTLRFMESRFGHNFSQVRVHTDAKATESVRAVNARAYTVGRNVVFGHGEYSQGNSEGQRLLAHELTHVVQQGAFQGSPTLLQRTPLSPGNILGSTKTERLLKFVTKWGRNASPFKLASTYWQLNKKGFSYWMNVRKSAKAGRALLKRIDVLERGARALKEAADELDRVECNTQHSLCQF